MFNTFRGHFLVHNYMVLNLDSPKTNTHKNTANITPLPPLSPVAHTNILP